MFNIIMIIASCFCLYVECKSKDVKFLKQMAMIGTVYMILFHVIRLIS